MIAVCCGIGRGGAWAAPGRAAGGTAPGASRADARRRRGRPTGTTGNRGRAGLRRRASEKRSPAHRRPASREPPASPGRGEPASPGWAPRAHRPSGLEPPERLGSRGGGRGLAPALRGRRCLPGPRGHRAGPAPQPVRRWAGRFARRLARPGERRLPGVAGRLASRRIGRAAAGAGAARGRLRACGRRHPRPCPLCRRPVRASPGWPWRRPRPCAARLGRRAWRRAGRLSGLRDRRRLGLRLCLHAARHDAGRTPGSAARSGARPPHSRRRLTSRACEK